MRRERQDHRSVRRRDERGVTLIMTSLVLIPLMIFAAFGVDVASWYSRASYLQRAADSASLAGVVWMPNFAKARTEACNSLRQNGIVDGAAYTRCVNGSPAADTDPFVVEISEGATPQSLRVRVTERSVDRFFAQVFAGRQSISRHAEAEYNLPIPLGSPLNYFGGTHTQTEPDQVLVWSVTWPTPHPSTSRRPSNYPCNVGTSAGQGLGSWNSSGSFSSSHIGSGTGNRLCTWEPVTVTVGAAAANEPFATTLRPRQVPCNRQQSPSSSEGGWNSGNPPTYTVNRHTSGTGNRQCEWVVVATPLSAEDQAVYTGVAPSNIPCNVPGLGRWEGGTFQPSTYHLSGTGFRTCSWNAQLMSEDRTPENPIPEDRSPNFWAFVLGPGNVAANGDPYSTWCRTHYNCTNSSPTNLEYNADEQRRGFWYVIDVPTSGTLDVRVFDAALNISNSFGSAFRDHTEGSAPEADFETEYIVYESRNKLDPLSDPRRLGSSPASSPTPTCWWRVRKQEEFHEQWHSLCQFSASAGSQYLINVRTNRAGSNNAGSNRYAIEVVLDGDRRHPNSPNIYALGSMGVYNRFIPQSGVTTQLGRFYLAKVEEKHKGKTLVISLYDAGDSVQNAVVYPTRPSTAHAGLERVSAADCAWISTTAPNVEINSSGNPVSGPTDSGGSKADSGRLRSGVRLSGTPQASDTSPHCGVRAAIGSARQFNGAWLDIRVRIPDDYTCDPSINPQVGPEATPAGSCWWGIEYEHSSTSGDTSDETTWRARIEGNPVQLTE